MDPNWVTCPYCEGEQHANQKTRDPLVAVAAERKTSVGNIPHQGGGGRRETKGMPSVPQNQASRHVGAGDTRRIVGTLITYTWRPEGILYPIREGKNYIGSGETSSEVVPEPCHIHIPEDGRMSGEHALILCRHGAYEIIDQRSSNGTFLNHTMLRANNSTEIPNYGEIQTGSTVFTFIQIEAPREIEPPPVGATLPRVEPSELPPRDPETDPPSGDRSPTIVR